MLSVDREFTRVRLPVCFEPWIHLVKLVRAHGGCLGIRSKGVEVCEKPGGVDKRALILGCLNCSYAEYIGVWRLTR